MTTELTPPKIPKNEETHKEQRDGGSGGRDLTEHDMAGNALHTYDVPQSESFDEDPHNPNGNND